MIDFITSHPIIIPAVSFMIAFAIVGVVCILTDRPHPDAFGRLRK